MDTIQVGFRMPKGIHTEFKFIVLRKGEKMADVINKLVFNYIQDNNGLNLPH